jgi:hypothetical protein
MTRLRTLSLAMVTVCWMRAERITVDGKTVELR